MINSLEVIKNFGIYENYIKSNKLNDFMKFNLFYGWNGSGKSTLSKLFRALEVKQTPSDFLKAEFKIKLDNGINISEKNLNDFKESIHVFNEDFINSNIEWDGKINSILLLSKERISETKEYNKLKKELYGSTEEGHVGLKTIHDNKLKDNENKKNENEKNLSSIAKNIKLNLQIIATTDSYYANYNKTKVQKFIDKDKDKLKDDSYKLTEQEIDALIKKATPIKKEAISRKMNEINISKIKEISESIKEITQRKVSATVIENLKGNSELSNWVETGLKLHKNSKALKCEFCGQMLLPGRIEELENHYNDALNKLKLNIKELVTKIQESKVDEASSVLDKQLFYPEFEEIVTQINEKNAELLKKINFQLEKYEEVLSNKENSPFNAFCIEEENIFEKINLFNQNADKLNDIIKKHNEKTLNFELEIKKAKESLEMQFLKEQLSDCNYFKMCDIIFKQECDIKKEASLIAVKEKRLLELESILSNETLGAEEFNFKLEKFLGYNEIKLVFNPDEKGYKIIRGTLNEEAHNLSEGEKTSIAFIYFITKLKENKNKIEDSIIVIDDPISSFDSNKIFHAYAYLKSECINARQLFILTHNYNYYFLILGWFRKETVKDNLGKKKPNYRIYKIETDMVNGKRSGNIKNADVSLTQGSEYDYVFYNVYRLKGKVLSREEQIYCGNIARKLVESFLSFKFPNQRGDLLSLMNAAFSNEKDGVEKEEIYKFINVYSHHKKIDVFEELDTDIIEASSIPVIDSILNMIEKLDKGHYDAMVRLAEKEIGNS